jgi:hypothetical protein
MTGRISLTFVLVALGAMHTSSPLAAQSGPNVAVAANKLAWRSIGPALMAGRIADVEVHPTDRSTWYVAVGSGGVWKTTNAGVTFEPIFDAQLSY